MDEFELRLSVLMEERADGVEVRDRLDEVVSMPVVQPTARPKGWWLGVAAALLLMAVGVWVFSRQGTPQHSLTPTASTLASAPVADWSELPAPPFEPEPGSSVATDRGWLVWTSDPVPQMVYFDPQVGAWSGVPLTPVGATHRVTGAVWTGDAVVVTLDGESLVQTLDPDTMVWREVAFEPGLEASWGPVVGVRPFGERVIVWSTSGTPFRLMVLDPRSGDYQVLPDAPNTDRWIAPPGEGLNTFAVVASGRWVFMVASSHNTGAAPCTATEVRGYDTADGTWHSFTAPAAWSPAVVAPIDTGLLFAGLEGCTDGSQQGVAVLDAETGTWTELGNGPAHQVLVGTTPALGAPTADGPVFAGWHGAPLQYDAATDRWWAGSAPPEDGVPAAAVVIEGSYYVWMPATSGFPNGRVFRTVLTESAQWVPSAEWHGVAPPRGIWGVTAEVSTGDQWFVWGSPSPATEGGPLSGAALDASGTWTSVPPPIFGTEPGGVTAAVWDGHEIVAAVSVAGDVRFAALDPATLVWRVLSSKAAAGIPDAAPFFLRSAAGTVFAWWEGDGGALRLVRLDSASGDWLPVDSPPFRQSDGAPRFAMVSSDRGLMVVEFGYDGGAGQCMTYLHTNDAVHPGWLTNELADSPVDVSVVQAIGGQLLIAGQPCRGGAPTAILFDLDRWEVVPTSPPPTSAPMYVSAGSIVASGRVVLLDDQGRLLVYDQPADSWWVGTSVSDSVGVSRYAAVIEGTLYVWLGSGQIYRATLPPPSG